LIGGKQADLGLATAAQAAQSARGPGGRAKSMSKTRPLPLAPRLTEEEAAAHAAFVAKLGDKALWLSYEAKGE
jgi:DNA polymerase-3 subunit epsilon